MKSPQRIAVASLATVVLAFVLSFTLSHVFAARLADGIGRGLVAFGPPRSDSERSTEIVANDADLAFDGGRHGAGRSATTGKDAGRSHVVVVKRANGASDGGGAKPGGLHVSEHDVRRVFRNGAPDVDAVPAVDERGAAVGVMLRGVSRYRTPIHDGDVVTAVDGRPVKDVESGVVAAAAVLARGAPEVSAELLREGRPVHVIVGIPAEFRGDGGTH